MSSLMQLSSNVSPQTADFLSYLMIVVIAIFLISGPIIVLFYRRKMRRMKAAEVQTSKPS